jgi:predicted Zn-dependent protease
MRRWKSCTGAAFGHGVFMKGFARRFLAAAALALALSGQASAQSLLRDVEIEDWLDDYSRPIFRAAGIPADEIQILLVGDQSFNAFAGGLVMGVNTGLLTISETPNEIEGVIAHEAGHIAGGHTARSDEAYAAATRPMLLSLVLAAGAIAAGAPDAGLGLLALGQTVGIANALKYSRGQESSADQAALTYLEAVGSSAAGLIDSFKRLSSSQIVHGQRVNPYLQSHPLALARVNALEERAKLSPYFETKDTPEEIHRLRMIQAKILGFMQPTQYTLRQYPLSDNSDPARYARAVAYYRGTDMEKAVKEIDGLLSEHPDNPFFHELKGQMLFEFGRVAESIEPHRRSVELLPGKALLRINLGRALAASEDADNLNAAVKELKAALLLEPDNSFGWFELARAYGSLGNEPMADLAMAESRYNVGAKPEAAQFARRALRALPKGTPEWRQANDIVVASLGVEAASPRGGEDRPSPETTPAPERRRDEVPDPQFD